MTDEPTIEYTNTQRIPENIIIFTSHMEAAGACAERFNIQEFLWAEKFIQLKGWGEVDGLNKTNTEIWLYGDYFINMDYVYMRYLAESFGIPVIDKNKEEFNPYFIISNTVH
jgi:hypothetical protein